MKNKRILVTLLLIATFPTSFRAQEIRKAGDSSSPRTPAAATGSVTGAGTPGQLTKWTGISGTSTFNIGDSIITEDKFGNLGVGTTSPTSKLTVQGMIETTLGGFKFPDGTVQTTAGISSVFHDTTLIGGGTIGSPLGIAPGGVGTIHLANGAVTASKIAGGTVVRSLNGLTDNPSIIAGDNIAIAQGASSLTISATNAFTSVTHDLTLAGNGTSGSPLGIANPLFLDGSIPGGASHILTVRNAAQGGAAVFAGGGPGGTGLQSNGGEGGVSSGGGLGAEITGGGSRNGPPGDGLKASGGTGGVGIGGVGVRATGGDSNEEVGGAGLRAEGGTSGSTFGGPGIFTIGGLGSGSGHTGGDGIFAEGGFGQVGAVMGPAAEFDGNVEINGSLSKSSGSFKIDHPLDPENKYLYHSFVESPDMMNIYNGNVTTDQDGEADVILPDYFEALNRDFRYQLTVIGTFAQAIIAREVNGNRFAIKTSAPNVKVSWQVTGVRHDAYANAHRIPVEVDKNDKERGTFLHPDAFGQPEERSVQWARHPEFMKQVQETRARQIEDMRQKESAQR